MFAAASTVTPCGLVAGKVDPLVCEPPPGATTTIWLLPESATYTVPEASTAIPRGLLYPVP